MSNAHGHPGPSFAAGPWLAAVRDLAIILVCALLALVLVAEIAGETRRPGAASAADTRTVEWRPSHHELIAVKAATAGR